MNKRQFHLFCDSEFLDKFQRIYPNCLTRFLIRCIVKALSDKSFFTSVYFGDTYND